MLRSALCLTCSLLFLFGCQTQLPGADGRSATDNHATTDASLSDAEDLFKRGQTARQEWDKTGEPSTMKEAHGLLQRAFLLQPDNINIQYAFYTASMAMAASQYGVSSTDVHTLFDQLHPSVKTAVPSPTRLNFINAKNNGVAADALDAILLSGIRETPNDPYLWSQYAFLQQGKEQYHFAASIAKRAHELNIEDPAYAFQISNSLNALADTNSCPYDELALIQRAVKHANDASKKAPDNIDYVHQVAQLYFKLGLVPLAYDRAGKTYAMEKNRWSARNRASTSILMRKYDEAREAAEYLVNELEQDWARLYLAQIAVAEGQWEYASTQMKLYNSRHPPGIYEILIQQWIDAIANDDATRIDSESLSDENDWGQRILDYLNTPSEDAATLLNSAKSRCQRTEAHFYTALKAWQSGNKEDTLTHLKLATRQGAAPYLEHIFATVLLRSL